MVSQPRQRRFQGRHLLAQFGGQFGKGRRPQPAALEQRLQALPQRLIHRSKLRPMGWQTNARDLAHHPPFSRQFRHHGQHCFARQRRTFASRQHPVRSGAYPVRMALVPVSQGLDYLAAPALPVGWRKTEQADAALQQLHRNTLVQKSRFLRPEVAIGRETVKRHACRRWRQHCAQSRWVIFDLHGGQVSKACRSGPTTGRREHVDHAATAQRMAGRGVAHDESVAAQRPDGLIEHQLNPAAFTRGDRSALEHCHPSGHMCRA
ncbi:MAG: hypothetical protein ABIX12_12415 [Rubrivivax sp.]